MENSRKVIVKTWVWLCIWILDIKFSEWVLKFVTSEVQRELKIPWWCRAVVVHRYARAQTCRTLNVITRALNWILNLMKVCKCEEIKMRLLKDLIKRRTGPSQTAVFKSADFFPSAIAVQHWAHGIISWLSLVWFSLLTTFSCIYEIRHIKLCPQQNDKILDLFVVYPGVFTDPPTFYHDGDRTIEIIKTKT